MTEQPDSGKPQSVSQDYFIKRFGIDLALTSAQQKVYFTLPDCHRDMLENIIIQNPYNFQSKWLKSYLALICGDGEEESGYFKDEDKTAQRLWSDYLYFRQDVKTCMEVHEVSRLMFPLMGFHNLQSAFERCIRDLINDDVLPERGDGGLMAVICLPEFERIVHDHLDQVFHGLPDVWRGYLSEKKQSISVAEVVPEVTTKQQEAPSTARNRTELQIEKINIIKGESPALSNAELFEACQKLYPTLFSMTELSFRKNTLKAWRNTLK